MTPSPHLSEVAMAAGLPARYVYWFGRSGRRYLFTCTGADAAENFDGGVVIAVSGGQIVWIGEVAALQRMPAGSGPRRAEIYVHLLADSLAERRDIIEDLRPEEIVRLRLAA
jgi:hypothetical protein